MDLTSSGSIQDDSDIIQISDDEDNNMPLDMIPPNPTLMDFISIDDEDENDEYQYQPSSSSRVRPQAQPEQASRRNQPPRWPERFIESCQLRSATARSLGPTASTIKIGDTVEIQSSQSSGPVKAGDFLRVMKVVENALNDDVTLRGILFRRNKFLQPMLPRKLNEVHMVVTVDADDRRPYHIQGLEEVPLRNAFRKRRLIVTDLPFPVLSFRDSTYYDSGRPGAKHFEQDISEHEVLVCRNIFACIYGKGERNLLRRRPYQGLLRFVLPNEADSGGGLLMSKHVELVDLVDSDDDDNTVLVDDFIRHGPSRPRQYTMADSMQGAGGASCAAKLAGLKVTWGFDHDPIAVATASTNFPHARIFKCEAADFPPPGFEPHCDILHISPPCQPYSPANTNPNALRDEINTDCLFAVGSIIRAVKPRLVTLEETFGLFTQEKHNNWFGILLSMIHEEGYSVRWAIHNTLEYGISQPRKRLALIAAAPGVPLPLMPKPTHGKHGSGLPKFVTARQAIGSIPRGAPHHNPEMARRIERAPWEPDTPFNKTIMTSNSGVYHWSGQRKFTNRELATLQGFPHSYKFHGSQTDAERQIGNAVPPSYFKLIFQECIKTLRKLDRGRDRSVGAPSRTLSPAPLPSSQTSTGSSRDRPILIDGDGDYDVIELD